MTHPMEKLWKELELDGRCPVVCPNEVKRRVRTTLNAVPAERKRYMRQKLRFSLALAALVIALAGTTLALSPTLRELLTEAMGSFAPYAQAVDAAPATDQGIQITVESALIDRNAGMIYLSLRDLTGDRLSKGPGSIRARITRASGDEYDRTSSPAQEWQTYDPDTKTALYAMRYQAEESLTSRNRNLPLTLEITGIYPGQRYLDGCDLPQALLTNQTLKTQRLDTGETVLVPGQTPYALENDHGITLSSMGFDSSGHLHIQIQMSEDTDLEENRILSTVRSRSGSGTQYTRYNAWVEDVSFRSGGNIYLDLCYSASVADYEDIQVESIYGSYRITQPDIEGSWSLMVYPQDLPERVVTMREKIGRSTVREVYLTSLSATVRSEYDPNSTEPNIWSSQLTVYLKDGSHFSMRWGREYDLPQENGILHQYGAYLFPQGVDPADITGLAIGAWYIPISGGAGGPGYWLEQAPE